MTLVSSAQRLAIFGPLVDYPGGGRGVPDRLLVTVTSPWGPKVRIHRLVADHWLATAQAAAREVPEFQPRRIDSFAPRTIRGSSSISLHAYGLATDVFLTPLAQGAPAGGVWDPVELRTPLAAAWRAVWRKHGWTLGADWTSRKDTPHIEWGRGLPGPTLTPPPPPVEPPAPEEVPVLYRYPNGDPVVLDPPPRWLLSVGSCVVGVTDLGALYVMGPDGARDVVEAAIQASGYREAFQHRLVAPDPTWDGKVLNIRSHLGEDYWIPVVFPPAPAADIDPQLRARAAADRDAILEAHRILTARLSS